MAELYEYLGSFDHSSARLRVLCGSALKESL